MRNNITSIIILIVCFIIIFSFMNIAYAEEKADGYWWEKLSKVAKTFYVIGFIEGHRLGESQGALNGYGEGMDNVLKNLDSCKIEINKKDCGKKIASDSFKYINEKSLTPYKINSENITKEIDAFYQTYPLCKSIEIDFMFQELIQAFRITDKKSFKEIGEGCAKHKP